MNKLLVPLAVSAGILLVLLAGIYVALPAQSLPHFMPGYATGLARHHYTHAAASLGLGLVCFAYAWFASGKKSSSK